MIDFWFKFKLFDFIELIFGISNLLIIDVFISFIVGFWMSYDLSCKEFYL